MTTPHAAVELRILRSGDADALASVAPGVFDHAVDLGTARAFLADTRHHLAVAVEGGTVVGFASGVHYSIPTSPRRRCS